MVSKTKWVCLIAVVLAASGCGKSGGTGDTQGVENDDPQIVVDDVIDTDVAPIAEVTDTTEVTDATAVPVAAVSSAKMDAFVTNPLLAEIPAELSGATSIAVPRDYVTNPLIN